MSFASRKMDERFKGRKNCSRNETPAVKGKVNISRQERLRKNCRGYGRHNTSSLK